MQIPIKREIQLTSPAANNLLDKYNTTKSVNAPLFEAVFLTYFHFHYDTVVLNNCCEDAKHAAMYLDRIEFLYKLYLIQEHKTLHTISKSLNIVDKSYPSLLAGALAMVEQMETFCLQNEFYEVMPRHFKAKSRIIKIILRLITRRVIKNTKKTN